MPNTHIQEEACSVFIQHTQVWLDQVVIGLNLCPFAKRERDRHSIHMTVTSANSERLLLEALQGQFQHLDANPQIATSVLIHPEVLKDFDDYNQFLGTADGLLIMSGYEGVFQLASFHPRYQFAGTDLDAAENYTNRSPYPMLHILREESVSVAIDAHPDVDAIPTRNIALMEQLGSEHMQHLVENIID